ncbi:MAG: 2-dehydropantoate 2-reductase [Candidatus Lokiarchaeota archaeon]|nr:2-dehydropantoate 2-reductase [Candidatus Harpocratesius repetitus]
MVEGNESVKILVVGPGAIGCAVVGSLAYHNIPVKILGKAHHKDYFSKNPARYIKNDETLEGMAEVLTMDELKDNPFKPDYIIITLKANHTIDLIKQLGEVYSSDIPIVSLQNGLIAYDIAATSLFDNVFGCVVGFNIKKESLGVSIQASEGSLVLGRISGKDNKSSDVPDFIRNSLEKVAPLIISETIAGDIWMKVLINSVINPLSAIGDCALGELANSNESVYLCLWAWKEMVDVAIKHGITLNPFEGKLYPEVLYIYDIISYAIARTVLSRIVYPHRNAIISMLQDIRAGRITEIDYLNGKILEIGKSYGMDLPVNELLVDYVKQLEQKKIHGGKALLRKFYRQVLSTRNRNTAPKYYIEY